MISPVGLVNVGGKRQGAYGWEISLRLVSNNISMSMRWEFLGPYNVCYGLNASNC